MRYIFIILVVPILGLNCLSDRSLAKKKKSDTPPNIILIISDDQAWTDYGFMQHPHISTPNLDRLASESRTFTRGYVPTSLCAPSLASIITGVFPRKHMVLGNDRYPDLANIDKDRSKRASNYKPVIDHFQTLNTLPKMLKEKNYLSFQTGKWWLGNYSNGGFDLGMTHGDPNRGGRHGDFGLEIGRKGMDTLFRFIDQSLEVAKPFFAWYAPFLPHSPHNPPDELLEKYEALAPSIHVARYWAMCEWFDQTCGQLMDYIDQRGLAENTLFVYVCDNGWVQNEDDRRYNPISKRSPYDYGMRTPIMFKWKGKITPLLDTTNFVSSLDIVPTILSEVGIDLPSELDGIDALDSMKLGGRPSIFGEIYTHDFNELEESLKYRIIYTPPYKLILPEPKSKDPKVELYNIIEDPFEQNNIAVENEDLVERMKETLEKEWKS